MNVFVTTQMRTGSTWLCDLLSGIMGVGWTFWEKGRDIPQERFKNFINDSKGTHIIKTHYAHPKTICECIRPNDRNNFVISITRDVKDVAISKILYMKTDKPMRTAARLKSLNDMRIEFDRKKLSDKDYINAFIRTPHFKHIVRNWKMYNDGYTHTNYNLIKYSNLHARRLFVCRELSKFLKLKKDDVLLGKVIRANNFRAKSGRKPGKGVNSAFRRKGIVGDHLNYLDPRSYKIISRLKRLL